jgi:hypothetical protein
VLRLSAQLWLFRYSDAGTTLDSRGWTFRRRFLEGLEHVAEVAAKGRHVGVLGAKGRLADRQRPLVLRPGALQVPKPAKHGPKPVIAPGDLWISRPECRLGDPQGALGDRPGLPVLAPLVQVVGRPVQQPTSLLPGTPSRSACPVAASAWGSSRAQADQLATSQLSLGKRWRSRPTAISAQRRSPWSPRRAWMTAWTSRCTEMVAGVTVASE